MIQLTLFPDFVVVESNDVYFVALVLQLSFSALLGSILLLVEHDYFEVHFLLDIDAVFNLSHNVVILGFKLVEDFFFLRFQMRVLLQ